MSWMTENLHRHTNTQKSSVYFLLIDWEGKALHSVAPQLWSIEAAPTGEQACFPLRKLLSQCRASSISEWDVTVLHLPYGRHSTAQPDVLPPDSLRQTLGKLLGASLWRDGYYSLERINSTHACCVWTSSVQRSISQQIIEALSVRFM